MFCGVLNQALPACCVPPLVSCRRVSSRPVLPLKVMTLAAELKPTGKLGAEPAATPMPSAALGCGLVVRVPEVAMALMVSLWLTVMVAEPTDLVDEVVAGALMA